MDIINSLIILLDLKVWLYLTVMSVEPDAAYWPSIVMDTDRTLSVCPSKVFKTPVLAKSQLFSVLSQDDVIICKVTFPVSPSLTEAVEMPEIASRWPFIVTSRGPPGRCCRDLNGISSGAWRSSRAAVTSFSRKGLQIHNTSSINTLGRLLHAHNYHEHDIAIGRLPLRRSNSSFLPPMYCHYHRQIFFCYQSTLNFK